ncbi:hypothetical protein BH23ACT9_BH23ACT9_34370 [soil metagenome]
MESSVDQALGRVALVLRLIGAVWMALLATVYGVGGGMMAPEASFAVTAIGVGWALVAWRGGWIDRPRGDPRVGLVLDVAVTSVVILGPGLLGETVTFSGGYPFGALVVGLAAAGRRGVVVTGAVLCGATLASGVVIGGPSLPFVVGNLLLYILGAVALSMGLDVIRTNERRARSAEAALAVAEERASTATHLHDSVLQTLALVQRRADDAGAVRSLVRRQERELRDWLFPDAVGFATAAAVPERPAPAVAGRLGRALEVQAEEVEERYGVAVAVVMVGGAAQLPVEDDERTGLRALVLAAREAMTNAAVHAGVDTVDVFAQTEPDCVAVYVRDRGSGFDLAAVPSDRQGVRGSIIGRMDRAGGSAAVRTRPGSGTEVQLRMPHHQGDDT